MSPELREIENDLICKNTGELCPGMQMVHKMYTSVTVPGHEDDTRAIALEDDNVRSFELLRIEAIAKRIGCKNGCAWLALQASINSHPATAKPHSLLKRGIKRIRNY